MTRPTRRRSRYPTRESSFRKGIGIGCGIWVGYLLLCVASVALFFLLMKSGACS